MSYAEKIMGAVDEASRAYHNSTRWHSEPDDGPTYYEQIEAECAEADAEIAALRAALAECAECLAEWVDQGYHQRKQYPDMQRRYERDMEPVARARALLEKPNGK